MSIITRISVPLLTEMPSLNIGDRVEISGVIFTGRDAILPKIVKLISNNRLSELPISLKGSAIMHTAFSPAGYGPTSSNKEEIEQSMPILSAAGVRFHLGKGAINQRTVEEISRYGSVFIVIPPLSALLLSRLTSKRIIAFSEEGMEAMHELIVKDIPGVVAAINGKSIFNK